MEKPIAYLRKLKDDVSLSEQRKNLVEYLKKDKIAPSFNIEDENGDGKVFTLIVNGMIRSGGCLFVLWKIESIASEFDSFLSLTRLVSEILESGNHIVCVGDRLDSRNGMAEFYKGLTDVFIEKTAVLKTERQRIAMRKLAQKGEQIGRPKTIDTDLVDRLKKQGLSNSEIARELDISLTSVKRNLRI